LNGLSFRQQKWDEAGSLAHPVRSDDKQHHAHWLDLAVGNEILDVLYLIHRTHLHCQHGRAKIIVGTSAGVHPRRRVIARIDGDIS
jgi:desulfoferrodoxin (superoxide reductase-like protein)